MEDLWKALAGCDFARQPAIIRKFHYAPEGDRVCSTEFVSQRQLTDDPKKVTCKLCLKVMSG